MNNKFSLLLSIFFLTGCSQAFAQGNSLLWKISGNGLKIPSYLYGTMHSKDNRVFHFADSVMAKFEECDAFAMEVVLSEDIQLQLMKDLLMDSGFVLKKLVSPAQYDSIDLYCKKNIGYSVGQFDRFKPIYTSLILSQAASYDSSKTKEREFFLDEYFQHVATDQKKNIYGLETIDEQMRVFDLLNYKQQAELLLQTIRSTGSDAMGMDDMLALYTSNDLARMMKFENDFNLPDTLYNSLFTERNQRMAVRIDTMLRRRTTFIAVGAGHLGGDFGLVSLLRDKGYRVVPILPSYNNYLSDNWYRYYSEKNKFCAEFPGSPKPSLKLIGGNYAASSYSFELISGSNLKSMNVGVMINPAVAAGEELFSYLLNSLKEKTGTDVTLVKTEVKWKGQTAIMAKAKMREKGEVEAMIIQNGNTIYTLSYIASGKINQKEKDRFFNSLQTFN